jgi:hypothetical protein
MNESETGEAIEILPVEDNPGAICMAQEALRDAKVNRLMKAVKVIDGMGICIVKRSAG